MFSNFNTIFKCNINEGFTFGCSYGMNEGVHKISIISKVDGFRRSAFGITTNIDCYRKEGIWFSSSKYIDSGAYIFYLNATTIGHTCPDYAFKKNNLTQWNVFETVNRKSGDTISIIFDADQWILEYLLNDKKLGTATMVKPDRTYYFFVSASTSQRVEYHLTID